MTHEQKARISSDALLKQAGWHVCSMADANIHAAGGVVLREFPRNNGYGFADYLLYRDGNVADVIDAKKDSNTLTGVKVQSARYAQGLPGCSYPLSTNPQASKPTSPKAYGPLKATLSKAFIGGQKS